MKKQKKFFLKENESSKNENVFKKLDEKSLFCIKGARDSYYKGTYSNYAEGTYVRN